MSLQSYGLLKCKVISTKEERGLNRPHYNIHARAGTEQYRISINIKSDTSPSELLFYTIEDFQHDITSKISDLPYGFFVSQDVSIDYIRGEMGFERADMNKIICDRPGPNNDLNEKLTHYMNQATVSEDIDMYVFGSKWKSNNYCKPDRIFGFHPSMGMHDIHMNQGNTKHWKNDDGVWQDGCILIHFPSKDEWVGIFLAFQSQSWNNDDCTGHAKKKG
ncbi:MAG: hypothetical protein CVV02_05105 [Firmicutes bacterium HGW-Firmicutes-7]|nr:MAG: hypothetical protein CVV02_05105 [Firmicutes bacterium HGW-Firmicutes-7]